MITVTEIPMDHGKYNRKLWKLSEPVGYNYDYETDKLTETTEYVVTSAIGGLAYECYIFPSDSKGHILNWAEMDGSMKNTNNHEEVINNASWVIAS